MIGVLLSFDKWLREYARAGRSPGILPPGV
jgi:hypothetical protein